MTRDADPRVLERNVERLLTRAWRPVEPRAAFRAALAERVREHAARRWAPARPARVVPFTPRIALAAAAVLLAWLGLGPGFDGGAGRRSDEERDPLALADAGADAGADASSPALGDAAPGADAGAADLLSRQQGAGGSARRLVEPSAGPGAGEGDEPGPGTDAEAAPAALDVALVPPDGAPVPASARIVLLRAALLPDVAEPRVVEASFGAADGRAQLDGLEPGRHGVHVFADGFAPWRAEVDLVPGERLTLDVRLERGVAIDGTVVDAATGEPVVGALVISEDDVPLQVLSPTLERDDDVPALTATADVAGAFRLAPVSAGRHRLRATAPGYAPTWLAVDAPDATGGAPPRLELRRGGAVLGRAADPYDRPRADAVVVASYFESPGGARKGFYGYALTDADGRYRIADLPPGMHVLLLFEASTEDVPTAMVPVVLEAGDERRVDFVSDAETAVLDGVIVGADGAPLPFHAVTLTADFGIEPSRGGGELDSRRSELDSRRSELDGWTAVTADAEGRFRFDGVAPGRYALFGGARAGSSMVLWDTVTIDRGVDRTVRLVQPPRSLRGRVAARADGAPSIETTLILLRDDGASTTYAGRQITDGSGAFEFPGVAPGRYRLFALPSRPDLACARTDGLVVEAGADPQPVDLRLAPAGALALRLVDPEGQGVGRADLDLIHPDGFEVPDDGRLRASGDGATTIESLASGEWRVRVHAPGFESTERGFVAVAGETRSLTVILTPATPETNR